jgi:hypothetical protein
MLGSKMGRTGGLGGSHLPTQGLLLGLLELDRSVLPGVLSSIPRSTCSKKPPGI